MIVLFPRRSDLDFADRLILCLGLSVPVIVLVGVILNYSPFMIRSASVAVGMTIATVLLGGMALWRRSRVPLPERFTPELRPSTTQVAWVVSFALMAFVVYWVARPNERFTEFYVLGPQGGLENYARQLRPGEAFTVTLVLRNFERRRMEYRLRVPFDPAIGELHTPVIAHEGTWARTLRLKAPAGSGRTQLNFELYRPGDSTPYRQLYLRVDLVGSTQP
ncbi:putative membrane protein [Acinetobacter baumannii]|nr:putative membrane protein [Acinetobacter baumannii]